MRKFFLDSPDRRPMRTLAGAVACGTAALTVLTGCGSSGPGALSPRQVILLAQSQSKKITSLTASISEQANGLDVLTGKISAQYKPTIELSEDLQVFAAGQHVSVGAILTGQQLYLKIPGLDKLTHKPWVNIPLSVMSRVTGINFSQLLQSAANASPLAPTSILGASKNVHRVGYAVVNGVPTTEYSGSLSAAAAVNAMRKNGLGYLTTPALNALGNAVIHYSIWIDAQNHVRKSVTSETVGGTTIVTTIVIIAVNQPINITAPPPGQVAPLPKAAFSSASGGSAAPSTS